MREDLSGLGTKTVIFNEDTRYLHLHNICDTTTIKVTHKKDGESDIVAIPKINLLKFLEFENKRRVLEGDSQSVIKLHQVNDANDNGVLVIQNAVLDLTRGGEINLDTNNTIVVKFETLSSVKEDTFVENIEGKSGNSSEVIRLIKHTYDKKNDTKKVSLRKAQYLAFDTNSLPEEIEFVTNGNVQRFKVDFLIATNQQAFGIVVWDEDSAENFYGYKSMLVIPVAQAQQCTIIDEAQANDFDFYTL